MLIRLVEQCAILLAAAVLLGVPGAALVSLLRVRAALPDALAVPAAAMLGALVACAATAAQLLLEVRIVVPVLLHVAASLALAAAAVVVHRRRRARGDVTVPVARGWDRWTSVLVVVAAAFAWFIRGLIRLDGLYHVALTRKLIELRHPNFDNINRFRDGGPNPTYALPGWHELVGWCAWITHVDPIIAWEIMPVLVVALGALAAAGMARVLLDTPRAQPLGALAWVLMRVLYARREVDGDAILFGAVPGQVTFELVFPILFASIAVAMWSGSRQVFRTCVALFFACAASIVIYHANYIPYVAIVGLGFAAWWLVSGPFAAGAGRQLLRVAGGVAAACIVCFGAVLPMLAGIDDFGETDETRIDYHLTKTFGMTHIRGGHLYEMLGLPGMLAILLAPIVASRWKSRQLSVASGGLLALMTTCFIPPLFELLRHTGSLTLGLRINHVVGAFLGTMFAGAVLLAADAITERGWGVWRVRLLGAGVVVACMAVGVYLGYSRFSPEWPGYLSWVALVVLWVWRAVARLRGRGAASRTGDGELADEAALANAPGATPVRAPRLASGRLVAATALVLVVGLALPVGAISARRAVRRMDPFTAGTTQGDLKCLGGPVERALGRLPAGSILLSDPGASFRAMARAPVYVVGDYKIWNALAQSDTKRRLASVNRFFDSSLEDRERLRELNQEHVDYLLLDLHDGRWLDQPGDADAPATRRLETLWRSVDRFADFQAYDGGGAVRLIRRNASWFDAVAVDPRSKRSAIPQAEAGDPPPPCNSYGLFRVVPKAER
ncbi:MAG: hypothetical protein JWM98_887 [Thermoleophilia bacterium]|nr:hypothetical protein [Thermoleophilia bacterium]